MLLWHIWNKDLAENMNLVLALYIKLPFQQFRLHMEITQPPATEPAHKQWQKDSPTWCQLLHCNSSNTLT